MWSNVFWLSWVQLMIIGCLYAHSRRLSKGQKLTKLWTFAYGAKAPIDPFLCRTFQSLFWHRLVTIAALILTAIQVGYAGRMYFNA